MTKSVDITLVVELRRRVRCWPGKLHALRLCKHVMNAVGLQGIDFLVAPYEADPQLAYLASLDTAKGGVAAVITEDSDLVAYGCPRTLFKLTRYQGTICSVCLCLLQNRSLLDSGAVRSCCVRS